MLTAVMATAMKTFLLRIQFSIGTTEIQSSLIIVFKERPAVNSGRKKGCQVTVTFFIQIVRHFKLGRGEVPFFIFVYRW